LWFERRRHAYELTRLASVCSRGEGVQSRG
jgi:hypothetical protein